MFAVSVIFVTGARLWMWIRLTRICFEAAIGQDLGPSWKRHVRVRSYLTRGLSVYELSKYVDSTAEEHVVDLMRFLYDRDLLRLAQILDASVHELRDGDLSTARQVTE